MYRTHASKRTNSYSNFSRMCVILLSKMHAGIRIQEWDLMCFIKFDKNVTFFSAVSQ